jgi:cation:H+ antiporter
VDGAILVLAYVGYLIYLAKSNHLIHNLNEYGKTGKRHSLANLGLIILSFGIMVVVTNRVVHAAVTLADLLPVSASFLGVILLGVAAALPELTTSLMSLSKGRGEISAGILIGSNITNPLFGIGIGAVISTYTAPDVVAFYDLPIKIGTAIMIYIFLRRHEDLNRREAVTLIGLFFVYILVRQLLYPEDSITIT